MKTLEDALAAIEAMKADHEAEKTAILAKNKELVAREKAAKTAADEAQTARDEAAADAAAKSGDVEAIKKSLETKHAKEIKALTDKNATYETRLSTLLVDNAINEAIAANGVLPQFAKAVSLMLKADAKMENGEAVANGLPLSDHISAFFTGADAAHFVAAPNTSGGGATGSTARADKWSKPPVTAAEFQAWDKEAMANPAEFNARADSWSRPELKV